MAGDVPVWPDNMALMTVKGGCLHIPALLSYASIIDTFFSIVNHYFSHDNDYITNWEVNRNDKLFSIMGDHEETGYLHLYTDS